MTKTTINFNGYQYRHGANINNRGVVTNVFIERKAINNNNNNNKWVKYDNVNTNTYQEVVKKLKTASLTRSRLEDLLGALRSNNRYTNKIKQIVQSRNPQLKNNSEIKNYLERANSETIKNIYQAAFNSA